MNHVNKIALILSFIFPGFGQMWNREYMKGISFIIIHIILVIFLIYPESSLFTLSMIAMPSLWVWGMVDASRIYYNYSSEYRRVQRRRNIRITLGIIAFWIVSEAIFIPTTLTTIRRNDKNSSEYISNDASIMNPTSIAESSTSVNDIDAPDGNKTYSPSDLGTQQKQSNSSAIPNEDTLQYSRQTLPSYPWVVTVRVSEKYDEINKLYHELRNKYQVQIIPVSSNPKHNAFAVIITNFATISDAKNVADELRKDIPECFVASYENPAIPAK